MNTEHIGSYTTQAIDLLVQRVPTVIGALATLFIWLWIITWVGKIVDKWFEKSNIDITVSKFLSSLISIWLKVMLLISVASMFGIQTTSFIALLWAAGLAIGIALQWSLSNFAGWVLILLFKPYKIWDLVDIQGLKGHVSEIGILNTTLTTLENNTAVIPNGPIINDNILNLTTKDSIRVDVKVGIAYDEDIDNARAVLMSVINNAPNVMYDNPKNWIFVNELADSSVNLIVRAYVAPEKYRATYFYLTEYAKKALDEANISIPFPHRIIHTSTEKL
jgi:small conductance mechanosensitive channel